MHRAGNVALDPATAKKLRLDPARSARRAGLKYVDDRGPGIRRRKSGHGFSYLDAHNRVLRNEATLRRIRSLAIPPAWTDVWICPHANGHIQATGRDAKGRKQYRYHTRFREVRDETKYHKIFEFSSALPKIRARCERDLTKPGLSREKVLAAAVRLLEQTFIRVGNEEYTRLNQSFGLTTLRDRHAKIRGSTIEFRFRGKSGKDRTVKLYDARLARIVKRCQDLPGEILFQYLDEDGSIRSIGSSDVNQYLHEITGEDFTAKDFRTWAGTLLAAAALAELGLSRTHTDAKKRIAEAVRQTAQQLGNTPAVCRKCYIHPAVTDAYVRGRTVARVSVVSGKSSRTGLRAEEKAVIALLRHAMTSARALDVPGGLERTLERSLRHARVGKTPKAAAARLARRASHA